MRISDWSSDVCSSDLFPAAPVADCVVADRLLREPGLRTMGRPPRPGRLRGLDVQGRDGGCCIPGAPRDGDEAGRPAGGEQAGEARILASTPLLFLMLFLLMLAGRRLEIGRASCRERVCHDV